MNRRLVHRYVTVEERDGVAIVAWDRPPTNEIDHALGHEIAAAAHAVDDDPQFTAVVLTGGPKIFSSGLDLRELERAGRGRADEAVALARVAADAVARIRKPTVAAVSGYALGAGLDLALAADRRIAGDNVKVGFPEVTAGLVPAAPERIVAAIGASHAKDIVLSGRFVDHVEAATVGLLDEIVAPDDVDAVAFAWASAFRGSPSATALAKASIDAVARGADTRAPVTTAYGGRDREIGVRSAIADGPGRAQFDPLAPA